MSRIVGILIGAAALSGCLPQLEPGVTMPLSSKQIEAVGAGVRVALKDPASAQISELTAVRYSDAQDLLMVCGYVNARNSFGGYTGFVPFYGHLSDFGSGTRFEVGAIGSPSDDNFGIRHVCKQSGAAI